MSVKFYGAKPTLEPSSRRPGHAAATEQMQVRVEHTLSRVRAGVEDQPEAGFGDALRLRQCAAGHHKGGQAGRIIGGQLDRVLVVRGRDQQDVRGRLGVDVPEGDRVLVAVHLARGDLPGDDLAEDAVVAVVRHGVKPIWRAGARPDQAPDTRNTRRALRRHDYPGRASARRLPATSGIATDGEYGPDYLRVLREDWPA